MFKNTAGQQWVVFAFQDEGGANPAEPVTGDAGNITANVRIDAGAANDVDDLNPTELEDGYYSFGITAAESNGDSIVITPVSTTANVNVIGVPGAVYTRTDVSGVEAKIDTIDTNVDDIETAVITNATGTDIAADIIALKAETVLIVADTGELQSDDIPGTLAALNDIAAGDVWAIDATTQQTQGTFGQAVGDPVADATTIYQAVATDASGDNVAVDVVAVKAETALIVADTSELQTDDIPTAIAAVQSDTDDIQTRLPTTLIGGRMDSDVEAINNSTVAAIQLALSAAVIENGACEGTPTTTVIQTDLAETQDTIYVGAVIIFYGAGNARGERTDVTDYTGATGTLTVTALANAPAAGDTFVLI